MGLLGYASGSASTTTLEKLLKLSLKKKVDKWKYFVSNVTNNDLSKLRLSGCGGNW